MKLRDLKELQKETKQMSENMKENLNTLIHQINDGTVKNLSEILPELENIWNIISEMSEEELSCE